MPVMDDIERERQIRKIVTKMQTTALSPNEKNDLQVLLTEPLPNAHVKGSLDSFLSEGIKCIDEKYLNMRNFIVDLLKSHDLSVLEKASIITLLTVHR